VSGRLAGYLEVLGLRDQGGTAELLTGQFHDVVLAGDVAYRFPRDEGSRRKLPAAAALLAALDRAGLPTAVPAPLATDHLRDPLGRCYLPLTRLHGGPLAAVSGSHAEDAVITQLAGLLDRLAQLGSHPAIRQLVPRAGPDHWLAFSGQVREILYPLMSALGRQRADAELAAVTSLVATGSALVHTDLGGANLLWTTKSGLPHLAGVLDWDGCWIGGQASDLASIAVTVGWRIAGRIGARRPATADSVLAEARIIAATFALQQALPAAISGDQTSLDEGLREYR